MSFQATAAAISGLVAGWMLDEASGTTLADFGTNNLPLTLSARGTLAGTAVLPESARALTSGGATGAGTTTRAVTGGTPLQLAAGVTYCGWITMTATGSTKWIGGRLNNWQIRAAGGAGTLSALVWVGGAAKTATGRTNIVAGKRAFVALTYDGKDVLLIINGAIEARVTAPGTINATTDAMEVGSSGASNPFDGQMQGFAVYNRALSLGELRKLMRAGDTTLDLSPGAAIFDLVADDSPVVAAAAQTRHCGGCGGLMRANERAIITSTDAWHGSCYALSLKATVASPATLADFGGRSVQLIREFINVISRRTTTDDGQYHDGTRFQGLAAITGSAAWPTVAGVGSAAAIVSRYLRAPKRSPWNRLIRLEVAEVLAHQASYGGFEDTPGGLRDNYFAQMELGMMVLLSKTSIEPATWTVWRDAFLKSALWMKNGAPGDVYRESNYYVNGNFEVMEAIVYQIAYKLTNDPAWSAAYETQLAFMIAPPAGAAGGRTDHTATGFGLFDGAIVATGTVATTSSSPTATGLATTTGAFTVGGPVTGPGIAGGTTILDIAGSTVTLSKNATATSASAAITQHSGAAITQANLLSLSDTTDKAYLAESPDGVTIGLDWGYLALQCSFMTRLYALSGDARALKLMNLMRNKLNDRLNRTTWTLDATGGTRQNIATAWTTVVEHVLVLKAGRSDITTADITAQWTASAGIEANYRGQGMSFSNVSYYRGLGLDIAALLMVQADWPGLPS